MWNFLIDAPSERRAGGASLFFSVLLFVAIPLYLYINLFTLTGIPHYIVSDDGLFVFDGIRIGAGQHIYRDFFQFNAPGIDYVFFFAFRLFGVHVWVPNLVNLLIGTAVSWMALILARRLMPRIWADLTIAIFLVFVYGRWLDATHHWFSLFAILLAIVLLIPSRSPSRLAIAGILIGVAAFFTQPAGAAAWLAFAVTLFYDRPTSSSQQAMLYKQASLLCATLLTWTLLSASTLRNVGWRTLWYFQAIFPQRYERRVDDNPIAVFLHAFPHKISFLHVENLAFYLLLLATTPIALCILWRKRRQKPTRPQTNLTPMVFLATAGFLLMAEAITRPTWIRLYAEILPSLIVSFAALAYLLRARPRISLLLIVTLWLTVILSAARQTRLNHAQYGSIVSLPTGKIALLKEDAEELSFLAAHTHPGDLFFQAFAVHLYLPLGLSSPVYMDYLRQSAVTRPEFLQNAIDALQTNHVHYVVLRPASTIAIHPDPAQNHYLDPLFSYVNTHYTMVHRFSSKDELWELQQ